MPTKDKETSTIFLHAFTYEIRSHLKKTQKKTNIYSTQKHTFWLGWTLPIHYTTQNILSIWNQQPSHISKQKFKSTIICWGPKINNRKKSSSSTKTEGEVQVHLLGQKHSTHGYWKTTQYIEIHKAKSFFTPNTFVHNIISNSAAPIDTQITKTFLQPNIYGIVPIIIKPKNLC